MIERLTSIAAPASLDAARSPDPATIARQAIGEIGHRVLSWVGAAGGESRGAADWTAQADEPSGFTPDAGTLAQRGDVYGLNELAGEIGDQLGASPTQEGELRRALENFTRAAVVQVAGLSGAEGSRQVAGLGDALNAVDTTPAKGGVDGVVARLDAATARLSHGAGI